METQETEQDKATEKYAIPMLEKGFEVLELFAHHPQGLSMQGIIDKLGMPKTTVYRLLNSLQKMEYLAKNKETQHYYLSKKILRIGLAALGESNIVEQSLPPMRALRDKIKESIMLGGFMENKVVLLEQVLGSHNFTFLLRPGTSFCLHASAPGKLFLTYLPEDEREAALSTIEYTVFNKRTLSTEKQLRNEMAHIRKVGYSVDLEEELAGVHCVAAPIFNQFGTIVAALWTSGPSGRITKVMFPGVARTLIHTANTISASLGYITE